MIQTDFTTLTDLILPHEIDIFKEINIANFTLILDPNLISILKLIHHVISPMLNQLLTDII